MKRSYITGLFFLIIVLTISCSTTGTVLDDSIPPEESSKIAFYSFEPKSVNGFPVKLGSFKLLTIPQGTVDFAGDIRWDSYGYNVKYTFFAEDARFSCTLAGGKEYTAFTGFVYDNENKVRIWGIRLFNDIQKAGYPPENKLIGFIPFNPPVLSK